VEHKRRTFEELYFPHAIIKEWLSRFKGSNHHTQYFKSSEVQRQLRIRNYESLKMFSQEYRWIFN